MQVSSSQSQVVIQKYGFLVMAPIALVMHGLFLLIPFSQQKAVKEPEKKEELQPIDAIAQLPPIVTSASPTPKTSSSPAPIVQQQQNPIPAPIVQQPSVQTPVQQQPVKTPVPQQPIQTPVPQQPVQPQQVPPPPITSQSVLLGLSGTKSCSNNRKNCYRIVSRDNVKEELARKFGKPSTAIQFDGDDGHKIDAGFKIENLEGKDEYFYYVGAIHIRQSSEQLSRAEYDQISNEIM